MKRSEYMAIKPQFLSKYIRRYNEAIEAGYAERVIKMAQEDIDDQYPRVYRKENGIGIINLYGPMSEDGPDWIDLYYGYNGVAYKNLIRAAEEALKDDEVKMIRVNGNTPGGNIDGLEGAFQSLNFLAQKKEVTAYNHGMIASAGVWYTSAAQKVIAANPAALIGSIGVVIDTFDFSGFYTEMGIEEITITNTASPNKRPDLTKPEGRAIMIKELDALFGVFVQRVTSGRAIGIDGVKNLKGEMVIAADAVKIGLMDGIEGEAETTDSTGSSEPASAKNSNKENLSMEKDVKEAFEGITSTLNAINGRLDKVEGSQNQVNPIIESTTELKVGLSEEEKTFATNIITGGKYGALIVEEAAKALSGGSDISTLKSMVAAVDAVNEKTAGNEAEGAGGEETQPTGEVTPDAENKEPGYLDDEKSVAAEMKRIKGEA